MTDAELITEWNASGCPGCCRRWGVSRMTIYRAVRRLRASGVDVPTRKNGTPFRTDRDHGAVFWASQKEGMAAFSRRSGLTYEQVMYSCRKAVSR